MEDFTLEVDQLKRDIALLKRKQGISDESDMKSQLTNIEEYLSTILKIFKEAEEEMKIDMHDAVLVSEKLESVTKRLERIEMQNEKIARGVVALADMIEDLQSSVGNEQPVLPMIKTEKHEYVEQPKIQPKPLPSYDLPKQEERKKSFLNLKLSDGKK